MTAQSGLLDSSLAKPRISRQNLHGLLADGYWKDGVFTRFSEVDLKAIEDAFAETSLSQLHKKELISDDDVAQILSQDHTGFGVWLGFTPECRNVDGCRIAPILAGPGTPSSSLARVRQAATLLGKHSKFVVV